MNFSKKWPKGAARTAAVTAALAAALSFSACLNLFDPIDNPGGDAQTLSAARAAFDRGDLQEARELYAKLGANETARSETVFLDLDGCGAGIDAFGAALGGASSNAGTLITVLAEKMNARHGTACLATLLAAYKASQSFTDLNLKGFTGFLAAMAVAGEVLAHSTRITLDGELAKTDIVTSAATTAQCTVSGASCAGGCSVSDGISGVADTGDLNGYTTITPTWGVFHDALRAANTALSQMNVSSGPSSSLIASMLANGTPAVDNVYRCALHDIGVGR